MKNKLFILILIAFVAHLLFRVYSYNHEYMSTYDPEYWKQRYLNSQWVNPHSTESIGDDGLYAYVGWEYIHGLDPTLLQAETPPLGKYLIGLSILIFKNQNIFALIVGILALGTFYMLNLELFKNKLLAIIPVFLFSLEPIYYEQLRAPYLDLLQLLFLFLTFLFVYRKKYLVSAIFLGCFAATKFTYVAVIVAFSIGVYLVFQRKFPDVKKFTISLGLGLFVFLLSYAQFFLLGHSLREFLALQKWILHFYSIGAKPQILGMAFPLLFSGTWYTWWGEIIQVREWTIMWPIIFVSSIFAVVAMIKNYKTNFLLLALWCIFYLIFLTFTPVFPRYLLLILPFMYNLFIWVLLDFSRNIPSRLLPRL